MAKTFEITVRINAEYEIAPLINRLLDIIRTDFHFSDPEVVMAKRIEKPGLQIKDLPHDPFPFS